MRSTASDGFVWTFTATMSIRGTITSLTLVSPKSNTLETSSLFIGLVAAVLVPEELDPPLEGHDREREPVERVRARRVLSAATATYAVGHMR